MLTVDGDHVPVTPLSEVVGNTGAAEPLQIAGTGAKVGIVVEILKSRHAGRATFPQRSVTEPETLVKHTWKAPLVVMAGLSVRVRLFP